MKKSQLRKLIRELIKEEEEELEEMSATGNVAGYQTPHAFAKGDSTDDEYVDRLNKSTGYTRVNEEYTNRWLELKNSEATPNQKIGCGIRKIRYELQEMDKFLNWYNRIRMENEVPKDAYWKRTQSHIKKIKERVVKLVGKLQTLDTSLDDINESVNESSRRATDFFEDSKYGKAIHQLLKAKWDSKKVESFLEKLGNGNDVKNVRIIDFISGDVGLNIRKYKTLGDQLPDLMKQMETLYNEFLTESLTEVSPNDLLSFSQKYRGTKVKHWDGIEGTFAAVVVKSIINNTKVHPKDVVLKWDRRNAVLEIEVGGKKKKVKKKSISAEFITTLIKK